MTPALVTLRLATGEVVGPINIHGDGGALAVDAERRMRLALQRVAEDKRLVGILEPKPGHVRVYRSTRYGNFDERILDLRGAELVAVE